MKIKTSVKAGGVVKPANPTGGNGGGGDQGGGANIQ
jgi:hypothetical protein